MATITLSVPDRLKQEMDQTDWINWSSVARHAFIETLKDLKELELKKKIQKISEIDETDHGEIKDLVVKDVLKSVAETSKKLKSGKIKPMTLEEFNKWCDTI
jgi:hypothetical protein